MLRGSIVAMTLVLDEQEGKMPFERQWYGQDDIGKRCREGDMTHTTPNDGALCKAP